MSLISSKDYARENSETRPSTNQKKTKLDTASKTIKKKCSQCERTDAKNYPISEKETRWLCPLHIAMFQRKDLKEKPNFIKASVLNH